MNLFKKIDINGLKKTIQSYGPRGYVVKTERDEAGVDGRIVTYIDKGSYVAEQYKVLRTNLYSLSAEKPIKTVLITSSHPQEGKTITSCNLAVSLSMDMEKKVLLVDSDLRRPTIHNMLGLPKKPGLSEIFNKEIDIEYFIRKPAIGNLYVIPSGSTQINSSEMLSSTKVKDVIDKIRAEFNYAIFDTPPILSVTDACILGSLCDAVIFIIKAGVTQRDVIKEAFHMLEGAQAKPKACVLTNVRYLLDNYYFYRYKYYKYSEQA